MTWLDKLRSVPGAVSSKAKELKKGLASAPQQPTAQQDTVTSGQATVDPNAPQGTPNAGAPTVPTSDTKQDTQQLEFVAQATRNAERQFHTQGLQNGLMAFITGANIAGGKGQEVMIGELARQIASSLKDKGCTKLDPKQINTLIGQVDTAQPIPEQMAQSLKVPLDMMQAACMTAMLRVFMAGTLAGATARSAAASGEPAQASSYSWPPDKTWGEPTLKTFIWKLSSVLKNVHKIDVSDANKGKVLTALLPASAWQNENDFVDALASESGVADKDVLQAAVRTTRSSWEEMIPFVVLSETLSQADPNAVSDPGRLKQYHAAAVKVCGRDPQAYYRAMAEKCHVDQQTLEQAYQDTDAVLEAGGLQQLDVLVRGAAEMATEHPSDKAASDPAKAFHDAPENVREAIERNVLRALQRGGRTVDPKVVHTLLDEIRNGAAGVSGKDVGIAFDEAVDKVGIPNQDRTSWRKAIVEAVGARNPEQLRETLYFVLLAKKLGKPVEEVMKAYRGNKTLGAMAQALNVDSTTLQSAHLESIQDREAELESLGYVDGSSSGGGGNGNIAPPGAGSGDGPGGRMMGGPLGPESLFGKEYEDRMRSLGIDPEYMKAVMASMNDQMKNSYAYTILNQMVGTQKMAFEQTKEIANTLMAMSVEAMQNSWQQMSTMIGGFQQAWTGFQKMLEQYAQSNKEVMQGWMKVFGATA